MRHQYLTPQIVDFIPERLDEGVLYICERYRTVVHRCCCGCGQEVVTPMSPADWSLRWERGVVSLHPSIGNWSFPCRSHYIIWKNQVIWAGSMTQAQVERVKKRDQAEKVAYIAAVNRQKADRDPSIQIDPSPEHAWSIFLRLWRAIFNRRLP